MASAWLQVYETELIGSPLPKSEGIWINMGCILFNAAWVLVAAALIDRFLPDSRRSLFWVMFASGSLLAVSAPFLLMGMSQGTQNMAGLVLSQLAWQFVIGTYTAPLTPWMVGRFPVRVRYIGLAVSYNLAQAVFGGPAELVLSGIATSSSLLEAPALYFSAVAVVSVAALLVSEFAPCAQVGRVASLKPAPSALNPRLLGGA